MTFPRVFISVRRRLGLLQAELTDDGDPPLVTSADPTWLPDVVRAWIERVSRQPRRPLPS